VSRSSDLLVIYTQTVVMHYRPHTFSLACACKEALISAVVVYWLAGGGGPSGPGWVGDGIVKLGIASILRISLNGLSAENMCAL
jgi:hypothetical protein